MITEPTIPAAAASAPEYLDGVEVISREPALITNYLHPDRPQVPVQTIHRVLLADEREVFQCRERPDDCDRFFDRAQSAVTHLASHSKKRDARRLERDRDESSRRRSAGVAEGQAARRARVNDIRDMGVAKFLTIQADTLELHARMLRAAAAVAAEVEARAVAQPEVSLGELEVLRQKAALVDQLGALTQPTAPRPGRRRAAE